MSTADRGARATGVRVKDDDAIVPEPTDPVDRPDRGVTRTFPPDDNPRLTGRAGDLTAAASPAEREGCRAAVLLRPDRALARPDDRVRVADNARVALPRPLGLAFWVILDRRVCEPAARDTERRERLGAGRATDPFEAPLDERTARVDFVRFGDVAADSAARPEIIANTAAAAYIRKQNRALIASLLSPLQLFTPNKSIAT